MSNTTENQNLVDLSSPLAVYNATEAALQKIKDDYGKLTIAGVNDKDGYKAVAEGLRIVVALRNKVDKRRLELKRQIDGGAKQILVELEPVEAHLRTERDKVDAEVARLKQEAAEAELKKFNNRTSGLFALGFTFGGSFYSLGNMTLTPDQIRTASDFDFGKIIEQATNVAAEIQRAKEAEAARLAKIEAREKALAEREAALKAVEAPAVEPPAQTVEMRVVEEGKSERTIQFSSEYVASNAPTPTATMPPKINLAEAVPAEVHEANTVPNPIAPKNQFYFAGYNACRTAVIEILSSPDKFTRAELINKINNLKA